MKEKNKAVFRIREFTRFYMPALDLLGNHYLGSDYSPAEARVLFEVYEHEGCNAACIAGAMNIDKSYLSRIIKKQEKEGYLIRTVSQKDSRSLDIHLTEAGREWTEEFIRRSNQQIGELLDPLDLNDCQELVEALDQVMRILGKCRV